MPVYKTDTWMLSKAVTDNGELIIRSRESLPVSEVRAKYQHLIVVRWPYVAGAGGMSDVATEKRMEMLAEALDVASDTDWSVEVASITGVGTKEWLFYAPDPSKFAELFSRVLVAHDPYPIELEAFEDPAGNGLAELLPGYPAD